MKNAKAIVIALAAILLVVVVLQNTDRVETRFLFFTVGMPRAVLLLVSALCGFAIGLLAGSGAWRRARRP